VLDAPGRLWRRPVEIGRHRTWEATVTYKTCTTQNLDSRRCGSSRGREILTLTQAGSHVSGRDYSLIILQGRLDGENLTLDGGGTDPFGGTPTQHWRLRVPAIASPEPYRHAGDDRS